jgi:hypothetical protein
MCKKHEKDARCKLDGGCLYLSIKKRSQIFQHLCQLAGEIFGGTFYFGILHDLYIMLINT